MKRTLIMMCCLLVCSALYAQTLPQQAGDVKPLLTGDKVPPAALVTPAGERVQLQDKLKQQKTVLVFYRGGWCPYCNKQLSDLGMIEKQLAALGYQVIAVSPDSPKSLAGTVAKDKLGYQLLSDGKGMLIRAMGIAYQAPAHYAKVIKEYSAGENPDVLPVPAVFLVDTQGKIFFSYVNPDFKQRLNGKVLLAAAEAQQHD